jgi:hypothetical protein
LVKHPTVDLGDLDHLCAYVLGEAAVDTSDISNGDVDENGVIDVRDGLILHSYLQGIDTSSFRVGQIGVRAEQTIPVR